MGAESPQSILHAKLRQLSSAPLPPRPLQYDTVSYCEMSAVSHEEEKKKKEEGRLFLFSFQRLVWLSSACLKGKAAQAWGSVGRRRAKEAEWERLRGEEKKRGCWGGNTERASEQIAQAKLAQWAQYVLERFANRSLFFIAEMKAAWADRECQTHLLVCIADYALSMCAYV